MPDDDNDSGIGSGSGEAGTGAGGEAAGASQQLQADLASQTALVAKLQGMLADPDVVTVVKAKAENRSLRIVAGDGAAADAPQALPSVDEINGMTPAQLLDLTLRQVRQTVADTVSERVAPLQDAELGRQRTQLRTEAAGLAEKYEDFVEFGPQIKDLAGKGLTLEEAYVTARIRSGKGLPQEHRPEPTFSDRPTSVDIRREVREAPARLGRKGFQQDLAEVVGPAVDSVIEDYRTGRRRA
jgi:hypothetical protein